MNDAAHFLSGYKSNINFDYPKFYGYYSDYDWVVFCQLFGQMMDLPTGFPMYCRDLQFMKEQLQEKISDIPIEVWTGYPAQTNEHNALCDAQWNKELFKFLNKAEDDWNETTLKNKK